MKITAPEGGVCRSFTHNTQGPLLLTWFNFNPIMDNESHALLCVGWNYLFIPKLQRWHRWSLGMDKWLHPILYNGCDYLSMLGFKLNHVSKRCPRWQHGHDVNHGSTVLKTMIKLQLTLLPFLEGGNHEDDIPKYIFVKQNIWTLTTFTVHAMILVITNWVTKSICYLNQWWSYPQQHV